jgi:hypothetical protein
MWEALKKLLVKLDKLSFDELFYIKKKKISSSIENALSKEMCIVG